MFNEEKTIERLLTSLRAQTKKPYEVVIVDGGSSDNTLSEISNFIRRFGGLNLRLLSKPGSTIAQARNIGIRNSSGNIIAMTDAGCVAHKDWLEKITAPFGEQNADIVAGFYRMIGSAPLQKALSVFLGIPPHRFNPKTFLPSARSIAFTKSLWSEIGGFEETLERAGEDTLFNYRAIQHGARFVRVKSALVDWELPTTIWEAVRKFYIYAKGDVQAGIWWHPAQRISTHNLKIATIFIRYIVGILLLLLSIWISWMRFTIFLLFGLYLFWSVWKSRGVTPGTTAKLWMPVLQILSDCAVMWGVVAGVGKRHGI